MKTGLNISLISLSAAILIWGCSKKETTTPKEETPIHTPPTSSYEPGKSYKFEVSKDVLAIEYIAGDAQSKVILASPHGGGTSPSIMKTRVINFDYAKAYGGPLPNDPHHSATGFVAVTDTRTKEFTLEIADSIKKVTGFRPHVIINHIHRSKLDANRRKEVATQNDPYATSAWNKFHEYIDAAKATVNKNHSSGLFIDMHGHAHTPQRIEVGYLLSASQINGTSLNNLSTTTSIRALVNSNQTISTLLKGDNAFGTLLEKHTKYKTTPSKNYPNPVDKTIFTDGEYLNGGYNTARHGSKYSGKISGIQIEFNSEMRTSNTTTRRNNAGKVARAIKEYMEVYY